jgi:hypothetical protein
MLLSDPDLVRHILHIGRLTFIEGDFLGAEGEACLEVEAEDTRMSCFFSPP